MQHTACVARQPRSCGITVTTPQQRHDSSAAQQRLYSARMSSLPEERGTGAVDGSQAMVCTPPPTLDSCIYDVKPQEPSPFSHVSGMKNRFECLIKGLRAAGDEVMVFTPDHQPPAEYHGARVGIAMYFIINIKMWFSDVRACHFHVDDCARICCPCQASSC